MAMLTHTKHQSLLAAKKSLYVLYLPWIGHWYSGFIASLHFDLFLQVIVRNMYRYLYSFPQGEHNHRWILQKRLF